MPYLCRKYAYGIPSVKILEINWKISGNGRILEEYSGEF